MPVGDSRKEYLLTTVGGHFSLSPDELEVQGLFDSSALNSFLDDGNITSLTASVSSSDKDRKVTLSNKVSLISRLFPLISDPIIIAKLK